MTKKHASGVVISIITLLSGSYTVSAASVSPEKGTVLINNGNGFVKIDEDTYAAPGAQVMAKPGGVALISYNQHCSVRVVPGVIKTVEEAAPCTMGAGEASDPAAMLLAGGAIAAAVGVGVAASQDDDKPASP